MAINWGLAQTPNFAAAALGGYEAGQALRMRQAQTDLIQRRADMEERAAERETRKLEAWSDVVGGKSALSAGGGVGGTVNAPAPAQGSAMPAVTPPEAGAAPAPNQPRADGLQINWDALNAYAQLGPEEAKEAQGFAQFAVTSSKAHLELAQKHGEMKARAAFFLRQKPQSERAAALALMMPELQAAGFSPEDLAQARLDDASLDKDIAFGMTISDVIAKADRDRAFQAAEADRRADNARADRADARAEVRFGERDKDRAALAASGGGRVRTDLSDLDY